MKYQWTIILIGVISILFPFLHLPLSWEVLLQVAIGLVLILTGISIHQSRKGSLKKATLSSPPSRSSEKKPTRTTTLAELDASLHEQPLARGEQVYKEHDDGEILS